MRGLQCPFKKSAPNSLLNVDHLRIELDFSLFCQLCFGERVVHFLELRAIGIDENKGLDGLRD